MEVHNTKGGGKHTLAIMLCVMLIVLLNGYCCGAAVLVNSNSSFQGDGRLEECLFELGELDLELLVNPYISRMLKQGAGDDHPAMDALEASKVAIPCGQRGDSIAHCVGAKQGCTGTYNCH
ncbi:hypothetical protein I3843_03G082900 [Carya illinoinensis]|nr:hypothetical protein I3843_03G082900 [Carya illinoinensis]